MSVAPGSPGAVLETFDARPGLPPRVELKGITKRFGSNVANDDVTLDIRAGEVHSLLGENGAGKTTLMKILYGLYRADEGHILIDGEIASIRSPEDALALGIGMVHQHFMLIPTFTVAENYAVGQSALLRTWSQSQFEEKVVADAAAFGLPIDPTARVADLSVGQQQRVEIVRALGRGARVLILDEPTAVLTPQETRELMTALRGLVARGMSVVFISHKLKEVMEISDRISVLRAGRHVRTVTPDVTSERELALLMIGRNEAPIKRQASNKGAVVLAVRDLNVRDERAQHAVRDLSFDVHAGEIVGVAGVDGNGQSELSQALIGLRKISAGSVKLCGHDLAGRSPAQMIKAGVGFVTEDRQVFGLFPDLTVAENLVADRHSWPLFSQSGVLKRRTIKGAADELVRAFDIRPPDANRPVGTLSGGNKQKVVIARAFASEPKVLIVSQPTRGVDVGATEYIRRRLLAERQKGTAILLISADLDEVLALSDRVAVMYEGRFLATLPAEEATADRVGLLMAGIDTPAYPQNSAPALDPASGPAAHAS
jgi:simple sugar transport system ATP-binding protein